MRKKLLFAASLVAALVIFTGCAKDDEPEYTPVNAGDFVRVTSTRTVTPFDIIGQFGIDFPDVLAGEQVQAMLSLLINQDITVTKIAYLTESPDHSIVEASGIIAYSKNIADGKTPLKQIVSVQHGTCDIDEAPTLQTFPVELAPVFRSGNIVVMPDYLGYGLSRTKDLQHPYMHAKYTGTACADMLEAALYYLKNNMEIGISGNESIGLCGYSQGGQATIATLFELQKRGYTNRIDEVLAGAGPYDLQAVFDAFKDWYGKDYDRCGYIPFTMRGIIYGESLDVDLHNIYAPMVFESGMADAFNTTMLSDWHEKLGRDVSKVMHPDFLMADGQPNADIRKFLAALESNSILNCGTPARPETITLFHEPQDELVPYTCSVNASRQWGCKLTDLEIAQSNHLLGGIEFYLRYLGFWDLAKRYLSALLPEYTNSSRPTARIGLLLG